MFDRKEYNKKYYQRHRKEHDETTKKWTKEHPNYQKGYYENHKEQENVDSSRWQKTHLENYRGYNQKYHHKLKLTAFELLGNRCVNPYNIDHGGFSNIIECLQIDHINGGGCEHHKRRQTIGIISDVIKDPDRKLKYQLLCANCNWIKRFRDKEHN